jgi:outer membrane protein assembly complex protein YaeT
VLSFGKGLFAASRDEDSGNCEKAEPLLETPSPIIDEIAFVGLRRIAPTAVEAQISTRAGTPLDCLQVQSDVKALGRLGWFHEIVVKTQLVVAAVSASEEKVQHVRLVFRVEENPYLVRVEYSGSRLLSRSQIEKLLAERKLSPRFGEPANDFKLDHIARVIESALAELGHTESLVRMGRQESSNGTVAIRYEINDGPHLPVGRIDFAGHPELSARVVRREMHRTAPGGLLASWRGKGVFTREGFEEDRSKVLTFYRNNGFPEARIGNARTSIYEKTSSRWIPWPFHKTVQRLAVHVPIEAGPRYRVESVAIAPELAGAGGKHVRKVLAFSEAQARSPYSEKAIDDLRHAWLVASHPKHPQQQDSLLASIEASRTFDSGTHEVRVSIRPTGAPLLLVRRIEFRGEHRFSDRYLRRRIGLQEGQPFDERGLENGLARLTKTGYFHQIHKEDIQVEKNDVAHTADVTIRVSEAGQQRAAFSAGQGQFGNTLGIAYSVFDLLRREELLSAQIEGGPDSLQVILGLVLEGFLRSRSSLAISLFDNVLRPRFASSPKGPFYTSQSEGLNAGWSYALTPANTLSANYALSRSNTDYWFVLPPSLTGLPSPNLVTATSSSAIDVVLDHDPGSNRIVVANSISGGALGGTENIVRSNEQFARILPDPFFPPLSKVTPLPTSVTFGAAGSYQGDMPLYARLFSGDAQVRGLGSGELGPYVVTPASSPNGTQTYAALPAGANVVTTANVEYRVPLGGSAQAAGFFDLGSGWLLPNWLGKTRPVLLDSTNGVLHGSLGIELRWTIPEIQVPMRTYAAVNVLRLNRFLALPDGSLFHAHNKLFALGWALGSLF